MYQHIMVPLDGSELAECVLSHVISIATGCQIPRVTLIRVVTPIKLYGQETDMLTGDFERLVQTNRDVAKKYLDEKAEMLATKGVTAQTVVTFGIVVEALLDYAEKNNVDLVVIATHGRSGISRWVWGSVADRILRGSRMPVLMVRPPGCEPATRV